jgi:hypothetical protein
VECHTNRACKVLAARALGGQKSGRDFAAAQRPVFGLKGDVSPCIHAVSPDWVGDLAGWQTVLFKPG